MRNAVLPDRPAFHAFEFWTHGTEIVLVVPKAAWFGLYVVERWVLDSFAKACALTSEGFYVRSFEPSSLESALFLLGNASDDEANARFETWLRTDVSPVPRPSDLSPASCSSEGRSTIRDGDASPKLPTSATHAPNDDGAADFASVAARSESEVRHA